MKAIKSKVCKSLPVGANLKIVDNSGARIGRLLSVKSYKTRTRKLQAAGVGDLITVAIKAGKQDMVHTVVPAVVVRQKQEFTRPDGTKVRFEDNAAIILKDVRLGLPKGSLVKGPVSKEAAIRWKQVAKIASMVL